ncbi:MAG: DegT/DnrJ/EryC1/StrS family aminotransferase [Erysipelotrichales bacterium]|nr:DegT/DnrJ/EryC1/StrS family aminotransferase [Erysipelotrichales bacterium]
MNKIKQNKTPFFDALVSFNNEGIIPFDVPGHKRGRLVNEFVKEVGTKTMELDANLPRGLDNLNSPTGVIKESSKLLADAFGADYGFFLVNGSTVGILAMISSVIKANDKLILPRNVHKSAISGLIISGAVPIFVDPDIDEELGIANGVSFEKYKEAIIENPDAKAVFIINPTYFGVVTEIKKIIDFAHENDMAVIADEAHGSHFAFSRLMPRHAISLGADLSTGSLHKTGGSLTQSSIMLMNDNKFVTATRVRSILSMLQSTSPSSLLLASLDVARKGLALYGSDLLKKAVDLSHYACKQIGKIPGLKTYDDSYFKNTGCYKHDCTKLIINVTGLGLTGFDIYKIMKDDYHIQLELAESYVVLAVISIGTIQEDIDKLINAFKDISSTYYGKIIHKSNFKYKYLVPKHRFRPRDAYNAPKRFVRYKDAVGQIAAEAIMAYPPGIPLVIPGEEISKDMLKAMYNYRKEGSTLISQLSNGYIEVIDRDSWDKGDEVNEI